MRFYHYLVAICISLQVYFGAQRVDSAALGPMKVVASAIAGQVAEEADKSESRKSFKLTKTSSGIQSDLLQPLINPYDTLTSSS